MGGADGRQLIAAIVSGLERRRGEDGVEAVLKRIAEQDIRDGAFRAPVSKSLPACGHLPALLSELRMSESSLATALAAAADGLAWRQNPNYSDQAMGQTGYMDNYAYAEIIGRSGAYPGDDFLLGLMILGPNLHYRDHFHPAPELYWVLSHASEWKRGAGAFVPRAAGETIWHEPWVPHATRTGNRPLLAVWAWTREVSEPAKLVA